MSAHRRLSIVIALNFIAIALMLFCGHEADALSVTDYVATLAPMNISSSGQTAVPGAVLGALSGGQLDPTLQFVLMNSMLNQATKKAMESYPGRRESYQAATIKFQQSLCIIKAAFQQAMLISILPQLSASGSGSSAGIALAASFSKSEGCDGSGSQIDPNLLKSFSGTGSTTSASSSGSSSTGSSSSPSY